MNTIDKLKAETLQENYEEYLNSLDNALDEILRKHKMWLKDEEGGVRADLSGADLSFCDLSNTDLYGASLDRADLSGANLERAKLERTNLYRANLYGANLDGADLSGANLRCADLHGADLDGAKLHGANLYHANLAGAELDFSCLPLWCGSLSAQFDDRQLKQIAYHLVKAGLQSKNASEETKAELAKLIDFANGFHRVEECGEIKSDELK